MSFKQQMQLSTTEEFVYFFILVNNEVNVTVLKTDLEASPKESPWNLQLTIYNIFVYKTSSWTKSVVLCNFFNRLIIAY